MTAPQTIIFSITFLAISLVVNIILFLDQSQLKADYDLQNEQISQLQEEIRLNSNFKSEQLSKLNQMGGQQDELASIIKELQQELTNLDEEYKRTALTAQQTKRQLDDAQVKINLLAKQNEDQKQKIAQADITIRNQQRALKSALAEQSEAKNHQSTLSQLTTTLTPSFDNITISQASNGDVVVNVPLELIFTNTMEFTEQAESILNPIAQEILNLPDAEVTVIGHSDARPITSDLANLYPTNWELSAVRASKIVTFFNDSGINDAQLMASGKASNQPVRDENNAVAWAINRRIEIRIH